LNKRQHALAYHRARKMIGARVLGYYWIGGKENPADIVSKHLRLSPSVESAKTILILIWRHSKFNSPQEYRIQS
jgi:hypothetical protein